MSHHYSGPDWAFPRGDARLDLADLYAFPKPDHASKSVFVMNVHPSYGENPRGPTSNTPFAPEALYELKIDSDGDSVAEHSLPSAFFAIPERKPSGNFVPCGGQGRQCSRR
jgi:uncharacterized protein DUF4331